MPYGAEYWAAYGPKARVIVLPAAAPIKREVIELNELTAVDFSSDLVEMFEKACQNDLVDYACSMAELEQGEAGVSMMHNGCCRKNGRIIDKEEC